MIEQLFIDVENSFLSAVCYRAENSKSCVVFVHSYSNWKDEHDFMFSRMAKALMENGCSALTFDMRGHGESDLLLEEAGISTMSADVKAAAEYAKKEISENIILLSVGFSARFLNENAADGYILLAPCLNIPASLKKLGGFAGETIEKALSTLENRPLMEEDMEKMGMLPHFVSAELVNSEVYEASDITWNRDGKNGMIVYFEDEKIEKSFPDNYRRVTTTEGGRMFRSPIAVKTITDSVIDFVNSIQ